VTETFLLSKAGELATDVSEPSPAIHFVAIIMMDRAAFPVAQKEATRA
jgi:hypothetical protein